MPDRTTAQTDIASDTAAEDARWMESIAAGDKSAFSSLYDRYATPLYSVSLRITQDESDAEEVVQDVFLSIWKSADSYRQNRAKVFTWLFHLTRNRSIDRLRRRGRRPHTIQPTSEDDDPTEKIAVDSAVNLVYDRDQADCIKRQMGQLPDEQRVTIELSTLSGLTHQEISEHLEIPFGTVKSRIRYGLTKLRELAAICQ